MAPGKKSQQTIHHVKVTETDKMVHCACSRINKIRICRDRNSARTRPEGQLCHLLKGTFL